MNKELFQEWVESPVTEYVFEYFLDTVKGDTINLAEIIASGGIIDEKEQIQIAARCSKILEFTQIQYTEIEEFYTDEGD